MATTAMTKTTGIRGAKTRASNKKQGSAVPKLQVLNLAHHIAPTQLAAMHIADFVHRRVIRFAVMTPLVFQRCHLQVLTSRASPFGLCCHFSRHLARVSHTAVTPLASQDGHRHRRTKFLHVRCLATRLACQNGDFGPPAWSRKKWENTDFGRPRKQHRKKLAPKNENCSKIGFWRPFPIFRLFFPVFRGGRNLYLSYFSNFGQEARNPRSSRWAGSQKLGFHTPNHYIPAADRISITLSLSSLMTTCSMHRMVCATLGQRCPRPISRREGWWAARSMLYPQGFLSERERKKEEREKEEREIERIDRERE